MLSEQNIDVICTTISMFEDVQKSNRENITNYLEVYIKVPIEVLISRDQKGLYSRAINGEIKNVMGIDLDVEEPKNPDVVINNDGNNSPMKVLEELKIGIHNLQNIK
jgi:adenylylsulfate kinase-like enzyme